MTIYDQVDHLENQYHTVHVSLMEVGMTIHFQGDDERKRDERVRKGERQGNELKVLSRVRKLYRNEMGLKSDLGSVDDKINLSSGKARYELSLNIMIYIE
jgi:hypothetical protein